MSFFISEAAAQTAPTGGAGGASGILIMVAMFVVMYFLMIRPQQKRQKEHKSMVDGLAKGDEIVTMGGVLGKIVSTDENFITVEIANNTEVKIQRMSVQAMMPKGTIKGA